MVKNGGFTSGNRENEKWSFTFTSPGKYYYCCVCFFDSRVGVYRVDDFESL